MLERPLQSTDSIIKCLKEAYSIDCTTLTFLPLGADLNAAVFKAQAKDRKNYFIKLKRNYNHAISISITKLLHDAGFQHIILPIKTRDGQETYNFEDTTLIVYPFIEGEDGFKKELSHDQWFTLGKALRKIHETVVPETVKNQIKHEIYPNIWRESVRSFLTWGNIEAPDEIAVNFWGFFHKHKNDVQQLVDRADELAHKLKGQKAKHVLCHADIHGGNVLIDKNNAIYIVDWDDPIMAPKERDLMFIGGGVANVWNQPHEEEHFYKGYGVTDVDKDILAYYRHERIIEDIAIYTKEILTPQNPNDKKVMFQDFVDMFEPRGVVDIAFKT